MPLDTSTSITLFGVPVWDEGAVENFGRLHSSATRTLLCRWADRATVIDGLRGGTVIVGGVATFTPPAAYPDAPWLPVDSIDVIGVAGEDGLSVGANGMIAYTWARLKVVYKPPDYNETTETGSLALDFSTEVFSVPQGQPSFQYSFDAAPVPPEACPSIRQTTVTFVRTRRNVAAIPTATILALAGTVNAAAFEGAAIGTVRFDGASTQRRLTTAGEENWDITYKFVYRPSGWNSFFRPSSGTFAPVVSIAGGNPPYPSGDFDQLFT